MVTWRWWVKLVSRRTSSWRGRTHSIWRVDLLLPPFRKKMHNKRWYRWNHIIDELYRCSVVTWQSIMTTASASLSSDKVFTNNHDDWLQPHYAPRRFIRRRRTRSDGWLDRWHNNSLFTGLMSVWWTLSKVVFSSKSGCRDNSRWTSGDSSSRCQLLLVLVVVLTYHHHNMATT
jgi:hypothetical protein